MSLVSKKERSDLEWKSNYLIIFYAHDTDKILKQYKNKLCN